MSVCSEKMAALGEKSFCVLEYHMSNSVVTVQCAFCAKYLKDLPKDSPKFNVFCAISSPKVYSPFFFAEGTITGMTYLDVLQLWQM